MAMIELERSFSSQFEQDAKRLLSQSSNWLKTLRNEGLKVHHHLGIPTHKTEEWRFTNLHGLTSHSFKHSSFIQLSADQVEDFFYHELQGPRVVIVNGHFNQDLSAGLDQIKGLKIIGLKNALESDAKLIETHLGQVVDIENYTFTGLNTALFEDGVLIHVEKETVLENPIQILYLSIGEEQSNAHHPRSLFLVEQEAKAKILETYASLNDQTTFSNGVTEVILGENSQLEHVKFQRENSDSYHIGFIGVRQEANSRYLSDNITFGGALTRNDIHLWLGGSGIDSTLNGLYVINNEQIVDNHTRLDHAVEHCHSFEVYKGVIDDKASGVFNGKIFVHQDAQKTDAKQSNQALLLTPTASIHAQPQLEIFADDVKCTHGATVGYLTEEPLFYLRSRGIPEKEAKAMLIYAFANEVIEKISIEAVKKDVELLLYQKLRSNL